MAALQCFAYKIDSVSVGEAVGFPWDDTVVPYNNSAICTALSAAPLSS
jgi:hypothetical protein